MQSNRQNTNEKPKKRIKPTQPHPQHINTPNDSRIQIPCNQNCKDIKPNQEAPETACRKLTTTNNPKLETYEG